MNAKEEALEHLKELFVFKYGKPTLIPEAIDIAIEETKKEIIDIIKDWSDGNMPYSDIPAHFDCSKRTVDKLIDLIQSHIQTKTNARKE